MQTNVFEQISFSPEEAAALKMRSELHSQTIETIEKRGYTQADLPKRLHESQPRVSDLTTGKISKFSLETLLTPKPRRVSDTSFSSRTAVQAYRIR